MQISSLKDKIEHYLFIIPLFISALIFILASFVGIEQLWGFNFFKYYNNLMLYVIIVAIIIVSLPVVSKRILNYLEILSKLIIKKKHIRIYVILGHILIFSLLFFYYQAATTLLGDGTLRANQILKGQYILATEPLDFLAHAVVFQQFFQPIGLSVVESYIIISVLCGIIFIYGCFRLAMYLLPEQSYVVFLLMFSSGILVLFFGYIESYSIIASLLPHIYLSGLKVVDDKKGITNYIIWCIAGLLVHTITIFIFFPGLIIILLSKNRNEKTIKKISIFLFISLTIIILTAYLGRFGEYDILNLFLMPLFPQEEYWQGIITINHLLNILNWLLLSALPALFLGVFVSLKVKATEIFSNKRVLYSIWLIIPSFGFIFFFTPKLGGPRDWDLFALPAFILILSVLTIFLSIKKTKMPIQIIPLILIGLLNTFGFAMVNSDLKLSITRFEEIIEVSKFKNLTKEYITLVNYTSHPELADYRIDFLKKAWNQPPYNQSDSVFILAEFGQTYLEMGDKQQSWQYIEQALLVDSFYLNGFVTKINYLKQFGNKQELLDLARMLQHRFPDRAVGQMNAGVTFLQFGDIENGGECLARAWELDNNDYLIVLNYGIFQLQLTNYRNCIKIMKRAIEINKRSFLAHYYIAVSYSKLARFSKSKEYLSKAKSLVNSPQDARLYNDLKKSLK